MTDFTDFLKGLSDDEEGEEIAQAAKALEGLSGIIEDGEMKIVAEDEAKAIKYDGTLCRPVSWGRVSVDSIEEPCAGCGIPVYVAQKTLEVTGKDCPRFCPVCMTAKLEADKKEEA